MPPKRTAATSNSDPVANNCAVADDDDSGSELAQKNVRKKIKIEYIAERSRRHITFSKRKAGIMKKAYELSTLTGTDVLLLVASETGHIYSFATPRFDPFISSEPGRQLIQACLDRDPDQHFQQQPVQNQQGSTSLNQSVSAATAPYHHQHLSTDFSLTPNASDFNTTISANDQQPQHPSAHEEFVFPGLGNEYWPNSPNTHTASFPPHS